MVGQDILGHNLGLSLEHIIFLYFIFQGSKARSVSVGSDISGLGYLLSDMCRHETFILFFSEHNAVKDIKCNVLLNSQHCCHSRQ